MVSQTEKQRRMQLRRDVGNRKAPVEWTHEPGATYRIAYACFACRKSFKFVPDDTRESTCPDCGGSAYEMGRSFRTPGRAEVKQWLKVQTLFAHGFRFFSYRSYDCPRYPDNYREVADFIAANPDHPFRVAEPRPELFPDNSKS